MFTFIAPSDTTFSCDLFPPYVANSRTFSSSKPKRILPRPLRPSRWCPFPFPAYPHQQASSERNGSDVATSVRALHVISISFPGNGNADRMSLSPSTSAASHGSSRSLHLPQAGDLLLELGAKENVVATWDLRRGSGDPWKRPCWLVVAKERLAERAISFLFISFKSLIECHFIFQAGSLNLFKLTRCVSFLALYLTNSRSTHSIKATLLSFGATNSTLQAQRWRLEKPSRSAHKYPVATMQRSWKGSHLPGTSAEYLHCSPNPLPPPSPAALTAQTYPLTYPNGTD